MNTFTVANTVIRQDAEGRYCLNDLHRAAGGEKRHTPSRWLRISQVKAFIKELRGEGNSSAPNLVPNREENKALNRAYSNSISFLRPNLASDSEPELGFRNVAPVVTMAVGNPSTYIVKELVYDYAMWISPAFRLKVIRAYDALVNGEFLQPSIQAENYWFTRRPHWPPIRLRVLAGEAYSSIAEALQISRGRVARAVRSMIRVGLLAPMKVAEVQRGPAKRAALNYSEGWGQPLAPPRQLGLFDALPA
ncbi:hypothetical protein A2V82_16450 [candidate division KSB1 bacterium RBG_16_48_16]|nr:MAG: hypothetical protein A2V82_16450 [candidate division KSB1 bacterium RBG_16_48_16]